MTTTPLADNSFTHLASYGSFLLETCLDDAAATNLAFAKKVKLPLLSKLSHMSEEQLLLLVKQSIQEFLEQLKVNKGLAHSMEVLRKWRMDTLPNIPRHGVEVSDLVLVYHVRKQMLLSLVGRYTQDPATIIAIAQELDCFYAEVEQYAFGLFVDLKNEEHEKFNLLLQEEQVKLEETYEELIASRADLEEVNRALMVQVSKRTSTEAVLQKERNYLHAILENISDGIVACDENGVLSFFNRATRDFHGIPEKPLPAEQWSSYYHLYKPDGKTFLSKEEVPLFRAYSGESLDKVEMVIATADGDKKVLLAKGQPIISASGKKEGAVVVMHDITELKQAQQEQKKILQQLHTKNQELEATLKKLQAAEEQLLDANNKLEARILARTHELQRSEEQMRLITDALPVLITYVDADERYRFNNKTYEEWFGRPRAEVYGKSLVEVMGEKAYARVKDTVKRVLQGERISMESRLTYKHAGQKDVALHYIPHVVANNKVLGYFALITDISEHKKAQEELQQANQEVADLLLREKQAYAQAEANRSQLHNLFMQAPALMCIIRGRDFIFELANKPYLELLGAKESIVGKPIREVMPALDPDILKLLTHVMDTGENFIGREIPMTGVWKPGESPFTKYFNFIYDPLRNPDGTVGGIIGFGYDVSDHVRARQELERSASLLKSMNHQLSQKNTELNKTNNDLDNFVYTASHDLRSPVVNLEGLVMALKQHLKNPENKKPDTVIGMMETSINKLNKTIRDLTEITKAQKGLDEPEERVSIISILDELKPDLEKSIKEANADLIEDLQVTTITYAPRNLRSILYNLLTNAIKYRSQDRPLRIRISTYEENGFAVLSVQDNGLGLSAQQIPKLFTMFKRLHTHVEGTGIGLYIIKRIVENSGGSIEVISEPDTGSLFKVYLTPMEQEARISQSH